MTRFDGYVLCFHHDVLRSSFDLLCLHFMWRGSFKTSSFAPYVIFNTASQTKTSTLHDGNITGNQQISSHNDKTTPHNNIATVHYDKAPKHQDNTSRPKEKRLHKKVMAFHSIAIASNLLSQPVVFS